MKTKKMRCYLMAILVIVVVSGATNFVHASILKSTIEILHQPTDIYGYKGEYVYTTVEAEGEELKYQWYVALANSNRFYLSCNVTKKYETRMDEARDGRRVYCVITDKYGNKVVSDTVMLHLETAVITEQPKDIYGDNGAYVYTCVEAEGEGLKYQWYVALTNSNTFTRSSNVTEKYATRMDKARDGRRVYCVITDKFGNKMVSDTVTLHMKKCEHSYGKEVLDKKTNKGYRFEKSCDLCDRVEVVYYDAVLSFVDDDAKADALWHWERIMDATGIQMTSAVIPSKVTETTQYKGYYSYAGWDEIHRLQEKGMDFVHHTYNHKNLTTLTEEQLRADFQKCKEIMNVNGIESDILVYPNNAYNDTVLSVVPDYFDAGVTCGGIVNKSPFDNRFTINRVNINSSANKKMITFGDETIECQGIRTLDNMKTYVTSAVKNEGWLIFMTHAYDSPGGKTYFDEECEQTIIDLCKYVQGLGNVKIITLTEGKKLIGE